MREGKISFLKRKLKRKRSDRNHGGRESVEEKQAQGREDGYCCRKTLVLMPNFCQPWMIEVSRTQMRSLLFYINTWVGLCSVAEGRENAT